MKQKRFIVLNPAQSGVDNCWHVTDRDDTCSARCVGFANDIPGGEALARRIAASLNAFAGLTIDEIERMEQFDPIETSVTNEGGLVKAHQHVEREYLERMFEDVDGAERNLQEKMSQLSLVLTAHGRNIIMKPFYRLRAAKMKIIFAYSDMFRFGKIKFHK